MSSWSLRWASSSRWTRDTPAGPSCRKTSRLSSGALRICISLRAVCRFTHQHLNPAYKEIGCHLHSFITEISKFRIHFYHPYQAIKSSVLLCGVRILQVWKQNHFNLTSYTLFVAADSIHIDTRWPAATSRCGSPSGCCYYHSIGLQVLMDGAFLMWCLRHRCGSAGISPR